MPVLRMETVTWEFRRMNEDPIVAEVRHVHAVRVNG
jgi:hypothetical protein